MQRILVIGATGNVGGQVFSHLTKAETQVRALARNPDTAGFPPGVDVVRGDLTVPETLDAALDGIDTVFLVWTAPISAGAAALERITKRARRIVYLSAPYKTDHPMFQASQPNVVTAMHQEVERLIETSGREWTFVRPGMFSINAVDWWAEQTRAGDVVRFPHVNAPTAPIHEKDIAAVAVRVLCEDGHAGKEYVITGPESLTLAEQILTVGSVIGRTLRIEEMTPDETRLAWAGRFPAAAIEMILRALAGAIGQPAFVTNTVEEITGTPARTFREWAADHADGFRAERLSAST